MNRKTLEYLARKKAVPAANPPPPTPECLCPSPDWGKWMRMVDVQLHQGVALLHGLAPEGLRRWPHFYGSSVELRPWRLPGPPPPELDKAFHSALAVAESAVRTGVLPARPAPPGGTCFVLLTDFVKWANEWRFALPPQLAKLAEALQSPGARLGNSDDGDIAGEPQVLTRAPPENRSQGNEIPREAQPVPGTQSALIDWKQWRTMDTARLFELAALCVGVRPADVATRVPRLGGLGALSANLPEDAPAQAHQTFHRILKLAGATEPTSLPSSSKNRDYPAGARVRVSDFVRWASTIGIATPPELHAERAGGTAPSSRELVGKKEIANYLGKQLNRRAPDLKTIDRWFTEFGIAKRHRGRAVVVSEADLAHVVARVRQTGRG